MKKNKLLYFVSEDKYFISHKIKHVLYAKKQGFDVLVVCKISKFYDNIKSKGIKVVGIDLNRKNLNPFSQINVIFELLKIINRYNPDIIHNTALKPIIIGSLSALLFKKKCIVVNSFVGLGYLYINKNIKVNFLRFIINNLLKILLNKKNFYSVFQNEEDKELLLRKKILCSHNVFLIRGSGVDTNYFKPNKQIKKYDIILHSRMLIDKGIFEFIEAVKEVKKTLDLKVLLLGSPDIENLASIKEEILKKWQSKKIVDWIRHKENVLKYLNQSKISILPSYREGLPKSLLESASCGLPIIATNVVGCKEICIHNYNGILVEVKDSKSIVRAIKSLMNNKQKRLLFSKNGRKLVLNNFCVNKISKQFTDLYLKILK